MDTLFDTTDDGHGTVRVEIRLKFEPGPFDVAGWSLQVEIGGQLVALEITSVPGYPDYADAMDWLLQAVPARLQAAMLEHTRRTARDAAARVAKGGRDSRQ